MMKLINHNNKLLVALFLAVPLLFGNQLCAQSPGEQLFKSNCTSCHKTSDVRLVGPGLKGVNEKRSEEWLIKWIKNSQQLIASGDPDAVALFEEYNKMPMLAYDMLSDDEIKSILAYIDEANAASAAATASADDTGTSSITTVEPKMSETDQLIFNVVIAVLVIAMLALIGMIIFLRKMADQMGIPIAVGGPNYAIKLTLMIVIAGIIVYFLKIGLEQNIGMINVVMFMIFPYVALITFLLGSIIRYRQTGFQVSSLSSQFLEGRKLFWGSQPFHLGLAVLFFGHLIAFLFPRTIIAWNGSPVRLLILEGSAFVFALSALFGLVMLIRRRLVTKELLVVSNNMDLLVYVVLLTQILSGMGVAFFVRWGSSWFATVLTPYLRSIFALNPQIDAVSALPWLVQIHIFSAFFIVLLIPFTRFMHFLVAPVDYLWRSYQLVVWNWNRKGIRLSGKHTYGKDIKNH